MNWKPLADRVIVKKIEEDSKTPSGLFVVSKTEEGLKRAEVVAVGPGKFQGSIRVPVEVSVGDIIHYHHAYGTDLPDSDVYMILHEEDILAVESSE